MEQQNWKDWDKKVIFGVAAVVEGVIVNKIIGFNETCSFLNIALMPCWAWALIIWTVFILITYFIVIKGMYFLVLKFRIKRLIKFYPMPLDKAVKNGYQYASIIIKNEWKCDIEDFYGEIIDYEFFSEPQYEKVVYKKNHEATLESRMWVKKGVDYINPNRRPIENDENNKYITLGRGEEKRFNIAKCNKESGVVILNYGANKPISGQKKHNNEIKIAIVFGRKNIVSIKKIYLLCFSYLETMGMMFEKFEEYNEKG